MYNYIHVLMRDDRRKEERSKQFRELCVGYTYFLENNTCGHVCVYVYVYVCRYVGRC